MTYEGARSIIGPYLALLGANAAIVGFVSGLGELLGYVLRITSGYLADRTKKYWTITILGYTFNLIAVPLLALVGCCDSDTRRTCRQSDTCSCSRRHVISRRKSRV